MDTSPLAPSNRPIWSVKRSAVAGSICSASHRSSLTAREISSADRVDVRARAPRPRPTRFEHHRRSSEDRSRRQCRQTRRRPPGTGPRRAQRHLGAGTASPADGTAAPHSLACGERLKSFPRRRAARGARTTPACPPRQTFDPPALCSKAVSQTKQVHSCEGQPPPPRVSLAGTTAGSTKRIPARNRRPRYGFRSQAWERRATPATRAGSGMLGCRAG